MTIITIGIPTFNRSNMLLESVRSVQNQGCSDVEILIVDNASVDDTEKVCQSLAKNDKRIRYVRNKKNIGMLGSLKKIAKMARTSHLKYLMDDDLILPGALDEFAKCAKTYPQCSLIGCVPVLFKKKENIKIPKHVYIYAPQQPIDGALMGKFLARWTNTIGNFSSVLFRTNTLLRVLYKWDELPDNIWTPDILAMTNVLHYGSYICINKPLVAVRVHDGSMTNSLNTPESSRKTFEWENNLYYEFARLATADDDVFSYVATHISRHAWLRAVMWAKEKNYSEASYYLSLWAKSPTNIKSLLWAFEINRDVLMPVFCTKLEWFLRNFLFYLRNCLGGQNKNNVDLPYRYPRMRRFWKEHGF